ncbi:glucosylceramide transporter ABCA12-like [Haemaphysalis longicornis]
MDPETRRSIWELIGNLRERTTILLSTHDMEEAEVLADRIVFLCNGKVVCEGSPTFLKKACGVGYAINFNTKPGEFNAEETLDLVRETVPNAAIKDKKQGSLTIALHTTKHQGLATMFKKLEKEAGNLGIKSFGVSVATMADAYLIIDKDWAAEGAEANDLGASTSTEAAAPESAPAACTGLETRPATVQRVRALLAKRLLYFSRSPMTILMGCIVPTVLFTLYCLTVKGYVANFSGSLNSGKVKLQSSSHFPGAQCFIQDPLGTNFSRGFSALAKSEGLTMVPMTDAKSELLASARADFIKYYTLYPFGIVVNATTVEGWYNPASPVSRGVVLNLINTVLLRDYSGAPAARVNSVLGFFGSTAKEQEKIGDFLQFLSFLGPMFFWAFVPPALLGLTASTLVTFPVAEKLSGARELQLMTGVPGPLFIGTHFVFDFLLPYLVPFGACLTVYCFWYYDDLSFVTVEQFASRAKLAEKHKLYSSRHHLDHATSAEPSEVGSDTAANLTKVAPARDTAVNLTDVTPVRKS